MYNHEVTMQRDILLVHGQACQHTMELQSYFARNLIIDNKYQIKI